tara:strand:- start:156 stop:926 length:771 start_codon:yes stop_codon:yes gene_type:complete
MFIGSHTTVKPMKRTLALLFCLLMITISFTGCIGGDIETSEGEDVVLEDTDDWPTYYVPTSGDLPTCDSTTLGQLYYVEADTNFQACMSTGWQVVEIGGANANVLVNQPPRITAQITPLDDDAHNLTSDGWYYVATAHWSATDPEGETVTVGIDADRDGTIDLNLNTAEGFSMIELDWNGSVHVDRIELEGERFLHMYRIFDVIAEDASGATSTISVISPAMDSQLMRSLYDSNDEDDITFYFPDTPQADIDWLTA